MAEPPPPPSLSPAHTPTSTQQQTPAASVPDDMMACVAALEAALLPCLPARELQAVDRSLQSSHQSTNLLSRSSLPLPSLTCAAVSRAKIRVSWSVARPPFARTRCLLFRVQDSEVLVTGVSRVHERLCCNWPFLFPVDEFIW